MLLGIPQYAIASIMSGGFGWHISLITVLVLVAGVLLLTGRRYPRDIFELIIGLNRWVLRVCAYAAFLTPEYPPFRLDLSPTVPRPA